jgi:hypothetical protein
MQPCQTIAQFYMHRIANFVARMSACKRAFPRRSVTDATSTAVDVGGFQIPAAPATVLVAPNGARTTLPCTSAVSIVFTASVAAADPGAPVVLTFWLQYYNVRMPAATIRQPVGVRVRLDGGSVPVTLSWDVTLPAGTYLFQVLATQDGLVPYEIGCVGTMWLAQTHAAGPCMIPCCDPAAAQVAPVSVLGLALGTEDFVPIFSSPLQVAGVCPTAMAAVFTGHIVPLASEGFVNAQVQIAVQYSNVLTPGLVMSSLQPVVLDVVPTLTYPVAVALDVLLPAGTYTVNVAVEASIAIAVDVMGTLNVVRALGSVCV